MRWMQKLLILGIVVSITVVVLGAVYGWFLGQTIYQTTFDAKANVDFWNTWTLEWRVFYAAALLTLLSMLTSYLLFQRSTLLTFISAMTQTGPLLKRLDMKVAVPWRLLQTAGFFLFYVSIGGYSITGQNVAFLWMLMDRGAISVTIDQLATLFRLPFTPNASAATIVDLIPAMEAYQFYLGLISTFLLVAAARLTLSLVSDLVMRQRDMYVIISKALFIGTIIIIMEILTVPFWTVNAGTWMSYSALVVGLIASIIGGLLFLGMRLQSGDVRQRLRGKITQLEEDLARLQGEMLALRQEYEAGGTNMEDYRKRITLLMEDRANISNELRRLKLERLIPFSGSTRSFGIVAVFLIVMVVAFPVAQYFTYEIPMQGDRYLDWKFGMETQKEIVLTNWAAGLDNLEQLTLEDLTSNATPESEVEFLTTVRQWDNQASYLRMKNQIGTNWMALADSDIVYLRNHEYWIAPLTFDESTTATDFINQHLIYTHTEGLIVIDAFSGDILEDDNLVALVNRSEKINVYYGEGFYDVVFVNVEGFDEVGNVTFSGAPDYTLTGFESVFYTFTMGPSAWSYMGRNMDMLVERDVISRVDSVMLQGITIDRDPYIVVSPTGRIFYAVSVYTDYHLATGYAHENYMRFLGVVLVDVETGELEFYLPENFESIINPSFFLDGTYYEYYPWSLAPSWLQSQMKWPEDLYERQLEVTYITHVTDGSVWNSGRDFHQMPIDSDTRYIIMRIRGEERFVAMHNAEFREAQGRNLAGIYVMGCGDKGFGEMTFYGAGELGVSTLLGPNAAVQAFETADEVRTQLQLWGKHRYGNRLLYHLGGELFFVIPVLLEVETSTSDIVVQKLGGVGLVDAETGERVELGSNIIEAYYKMFGLLNQSVVEEGDVGIESASFDPVTVSSGEFSELSALLKNNDDVGHHLYLDISVAAGNFSVFWHGSEVTPVEYPQNRTFTLDIGNVGAGDTYGTSPMITAFLPAGVVLSQYLVVVTLRTEDGIVDQLTLFLTVT
ncbi:MAG: UPF0182 family protein [Candidatus Thorarchaeota archaeon]|nr:MAG: UPF0182 family protein [Candidatus Thorarchaeota archaeon]